MRIAALAGRMRSIARPPAEAVLFAIFHDDAEGAARGGVGDVERARGEGETGARVLDDAHDFEHEGLAVGEMLILGRGTRVGRDRDVEAGVAKPAESDVIGRCVELRVILEVLFDVGDDFFDLIGGGGVEDAEVAVHFAACSALVVVDVGVGEELVGHHDEGVFDRADEGGADPDFLDGAFDAVEADPVADVEGVVKEDDEGAEEVGEGVFGSEGQGGAADAEAGEK